MTMTATTATIVQRNGKSMWLCPNCGRIIGEVCGVRLIVVVKGHRINFPLIVGTRQTCHGCGFESEYQQ